MVRSVSYRSSRPSLNDTTGSSLIAGYTAMGRRPIAGALRPLQSVPESLMVESRVVVYEASVSTNISSTFVDRLYQINVSVTISVNRGDGKYLLSGV